MPIPPGDLLQDFRHLIQATKVINSTLSLDEQLPVIMDALIALTGADKAMLLLYDGSGALEVKAERSLRPDSAKDGKYSTGVIDQVMQTGAPVFILDTDLNRSLAQRTSIQSLQLRTVMCCPLSSKAGVIGALYVHSTTPVRAFTEAKKEIFHALADHAAIALENARLYAASISDPMTGLYNHAYCLRRLTEELARAKRYSRCLTFVLVDVDHFKQINDTLGHRKGDEVICRIADALRETVRTSDIPCRYGGDEFAIIVPETCGPQDTEGKTTLENGALIVAERLRARIAAEHVVGLQGISASIGVAVYPSDVLQGAEAADFIERADTAMYAAKKAGRNTVCEAAVGQRKTTP